MKLQRTYSPRPAEVDRSWWLIDATDVPLGRLASEVARLLRGKHKPQFAPHLDVGDFVVVVNAARVALTAEREDQKIYYRHSGFPGGIRAFTFREMMERKPEWVVEKAVRGMLPKNRLGRKMAKKLRVYAGPEHPHGSQAPQTYELDVRKVGPDA